MREFHKTDHKDQHGWLKALRSTFLVVLLLVVFAQAARAQLDPQTSVSVPPQSRSQFAIDDFDGDNRPDLASVEAGQRNGHATCYQIRFQLTAGPFQTIALTAPAGGLQLRSRDVNGDNFPDVVVTSFWTNQLVAVLLNDGMGNFSEAEPSRFPGAFTSSELSVTCGSYPIADAAAALFQRYLPGQCEGRASMSSPPRIVRLSTTETSHFIASSDGHLFFGRAPPSVHLPN